MATVVSYESCFMKLLRQILHFDPIHLLNNIQEMKLQNIAFLQWVTYFETKAEINYYVI